MSFNIIELKHYTIYPTDEDNRLYFEHNELGDESSGCMWFDINNLNTLVDYDGVFDLPKEIVRHMKSLGYDMSYADDILDENEVPHNDRL